MSEATDRNHFQTGNSSIAAVIASKGRAEILDDTLESLNGQTLKPQKVFVVVPSAEDLPRKNWGAGVEYIVGPLGSCAQRNGGIKAVPSDIELVAFFDDDFELSPDFLEKAMVFMKANPAVVGFSGRLLSDRGLSRAEAKSLVAKFEPEEHFQGMFFSKGKDHVLHGCNMVIRRAALAYEKFDENLPLYGYSEDYELSMRLERYGLIGKFAGCIGVHLESPGGRVREVQRGYSLVANNWYFLHKKTVHLPPVPAWIRFWTVCVGKTFLICFWNFLKRDQSKDWGGRIKGILIALQDILLGRCRPDRIKEF
jgi:GT2 family glycosyltransferase